MQKISPNTIPAKNLRNVLLSIREELPKTVGLPHDPRTHLFEYYKFLKSVTIFDGNHIIITTFIPLVEYSYQFDIFQAYSLPVPLVNRQEVENNNKDLLAYYKLESEFVAINSDRSKYILLSRSQVSECNEAGLKICNIRNPIRNVNVGHNCLISNFNQDKEKVNKVCDVWIHQTRLPTAYYLSNDVYLVITNQPTMFHLTCKDQRQSSRISVDPPFSFITLRRSCQATSNDFTLIGYFENKTEKTINNPAALMLKDYNFTDIRVWDDINGVIISNNNSIKIPKKLSNLEDFPLNNLVNELDSRDNLEPMEINHNKTLTWDIVIVSSLFALIVLLCCYKRFQTNFFSKISLHF
jgi:hypothetical protein